MQHMNKLLKHCLAERWGGFSDSVPHLPSLKRWAVKTWNLNGSVR